MKRVILTLIITMLLCTSVQATGLTLWGLTEQLSSVNEDNAIMARIGYDLTIGDSGGLEPFIGSVWRPREGTPQVIVIGAVQHLPDLIDPNSNIPYLPDIFLMVISEDVAIRPYFGGQFTVNLIDKDAGFYGMIAGTTIQLTPKANSQLVFEVSYDKTFGDLEGVPDNEIKGYVGFRIPF